MDNDKEKIKTSLANLGQEAQGWGAWAYSFWAQKDPTDALTSDIAALSSKWKDRIRVAFDLTDEISKEILSDLLRQDAAPGKSSHPNDSQSGHRP